MNCTGRFWGSRRPLLGNEWNSSWARAKYTLTRSTGRGLAVPGIPTSATASTNAASESINAKIQWVKYTARGFRNKKNFAAAILFHCGGLDLAP